MLFLGKVFLDEDETNAFFYQERRNRVNNDKFIVHHSRSEY